MPSSDLARPEGKQASRSTWYPRAHVKVIVLFGVVLLAFGAFLALFKPMLIVGKGEQMNNSARVFAGYLFSRNSALAALLAGAFALRARTLLAGFVALTALIQFVDAAVDCYEQRWAIVPIVVLLGVAFLFAAGSILGRPVWNLKAWRD